MATGASYGTLICHIAASYNIVQKTLVTSSAKIEKHCSYKPRNDIFIP